MRRLRLALMNSACIVALHAYGLRFKRPTRRIHRT